MSAQMLLDFAEELDRKPVNPEDAAGADRTRRKNCGA